MSVLFCSSIKFTNKMQWIVDKAPNQSFLNTAGWRCIVPRLYKVYPDDDVYLNVSVSSPPILKMENYQLKALLPLDVVINVLDANEVVPVACISVCDAVLSFKWFHGPWVMSCEKFFEQVGLHKILSLLEAEDADVRIHAVKVVANLAAEGVDRLS